MDGTAVEIRAVRSVGADTVAVDLEAPPEFDASPGQFVQLGADVDGERVTRHYTISSPSVEDEFEITVGVNPEGDLSPWLAAADAGTTVEVAGPFGRSYYEGEERSVVLAGGPGVGPAVGIGERAAADGHRVAVVYRDDEPSHETRLDELSGAGVPVFVVGEDEGLDDPVAEALDLVGGQAFVYGFADFVDDATASLAAAGYDADEAKVERFN